MVKAEPYENDGQIMMIVRIIPIFSADDNVTKNYDDCQDYPYF